MNKTFLDYVKLFLVISFLYIYYTIAIVLVGSIFLLMGSNNIVNSIIKMGFLGLLLFITYPLMLKSVLYINSFGKKSNTLVQNNNLLSVKQIKRLEENEIIKLLEKNDNNFSKERFYSFAISIFLVVMKAYSNNDLRKLRMYEDNNLYSRDLSDINEFKSRATKRIRSMITIKGCNLCNYEVIDNYEYLTIKMKARLLDYVIGDDDYVIHGYRDSFVEKIYNLTFFRKVGLKTTDKSLVIDNCPNCGSVIRVNDNGICEYCNSSLIDGEVSWVLYNIEE